MFARLFALKLFCAILLTGCAAAAEPKDDLSNDCGIIAAQAYARLKTSADWTRVLAFHGIRKVGANGIKPVHHIVTAYQLDPGSNILLFDGGGTCEIQTKSHEAKDIVAALEKLIGTLCVTEAHFISQ